MKRQWIAAGCAAALCSNAWAFQFGAPVTMPAKGLSSTVVIGDVNGDQLDDLVAATQFDTVAGVADDAAIYIYLQRADGTLAAPLKFPYTDATHLSAPDIVLGDVNGDAVPDIVVCSGLGLTILTRNGTSFASSRLGVGCTSLALLDVDLNGALDIVTRDSFSNVAWIYFGDGRGAFSRVTHDMPMDGAGVPGDLMVGDVTGDQLPDVVAREYQTVFPLDPAGHFGIARSYPYPEGWEMTAGAIGDFDGDGRNEVAFAQGGVSNAAVWLYHQDGNQGLASPLRLASSPEPSVALAIDVDRDGRTDLLMGHSQWAGLSWYRNTGHDLAPYATTDISFIGNYRAVAAGDLNDDGCTDAVVSDEPVGLHVLFGSECAPRHATSDFDGDGISDALWRNTSTGANAIWKSADPARQIGMPVVDLAWRIVATGDFNGDGQADLLWHRDSDGSSVIWFSARPTGAKTLVRVTDTAWTIVGAGDFNGDGKTDVLWHQGTSGHNVAWLSGNASTPLSVATMADLHWKIVGVDDFDGDGRSDILWRNEATGANGVWGAGNVALRRSLVGVTDANWVVGGTGDFDGDGKADIFWRNTSTGFNVVWRAANAATVLPVTRGGLGWQVVVGDYTGDRKADLLWRNPVTGEDLLWRAAQGSVKKDVTDVTTPAWRLVP